jgi:hypothetical protein
MSWIDELLENEMNRAPTLSDALGIVRAQVWSYLDRLLEQLFEPELVYAYGLDMLIDGLHKQAKKRGETWAAYENTYAHFAIEWLEENLPDEEEWEDLV